MDLKTCIEIVKPLAANKTEEAAVATLIDIAERACDVEGIYQRMTHGHTKEETAKVISGWLIHGEA